MQVGPLRHGERQLLHPRGYPRVEAGLGNRMLGVTPSPPMYWGQVDTGLTGTRRCGFCPGGDSQHAQVARKGLACRARSRRLGLSPIPRQGMRLYGLPQLPRHDVEIDPRGVQAGVAEEVLDRDQIGLPALQQ